MFKAYAAYGLACYHKLVFLQNFLSKFDCIMGLCSNMLWLIRLQDKLCMCCIECNFALFLEMS